MPTALPVEPIVHVLGGGDDNAARIITDGNVRMLIQGSQPVFEFPLVTTSPSVNSKPRNAQVFFRLDPESKWQFCVLFPSGVIQVISTEP